MMASLEKGEMDANCKENIYQLPMQDIVWIMGMEPFSNTADFEVNTQLVTLRDDRGVQLGNFVLDSPTSLQPSQIYELVWESIQKPFKGKSRRPRCLTFDNQQLFECVKTNGELFSEMKITIFYGEKITDFEDMKDLLTYQCNSCSMRGTWNCFNLCPMCKAVRYCSEECCEADWKGLLFGGIYHSHQVGCPKIKSYMEAVEPLKDFPFSFIEETSSIDFTLAKYKEFLIQHDVYNFGAWRYEHCSAVNIISEFGDLSMLNFPLVLAEEKELQSTEPIAAPVHPLTNWEAYYEWRGFSLNCPLAILLTYPLTLYYIITSCLSVHYSSNFPQSLVIHILGAEKEADMLVYFLELGHLLPSYKLEIHFFGNKISHKAHGFQKIQGNLTFYLHRKLWHKITSSNPHLVIGFNAGLAAYKSWTQTLKKLEEKEIPAYFTDYCHYSHDWSADHLQLLQLNARLVQPSINPFRSPVRKFCNEHCIPSYSNAFLSHLRYSGKESG